MYLPIHTVCKSKTIERQEPGYHFQRRYRRVIDELNANLHKKAKEDEERRLLNKRRKFTYPLLRMPNEITLLVLWEYSWDDVLDDMKLASSNMLAALRSDDTKELSQEYLRYLIRNGQFQYMYETEYTMHARPAQRRCNAIMNEAGRLELGQKKVGTPCLGRRLGDGLLRKASFSHLRELKITYQSDKRQLRVQLAEVLPRLNHLEKLTVWSKPRRLGRSRHGWKYMRLRDPDHVHSDGRRSFVGYLSAHLNVEAEIVLKQSNRTMREVEWQAGKGEVLTWIDRNGHPDDKHSDWNEESLTDIDYRQPSADDYDIGEISDRASSVEEWQKSEPEKSSEDPDLDWDDEEYDTEDDEAIEQGSSDMRDIIDTDTGGVDDSHEWSRLLSGKPDTDDENDADDEREPTEVKRRCQYVQGRT